MIFGPEGPPFDMLGWLSALDADLARGDIRTARRALWGIGHLLDLMGCGLVDEAKAAFAEAAARIQAKEAEEIERLLGGDTE